MVLLSLFFMLSACRAADMQIRITRPTLPVLTKMDANPVLRVEIIRNNSATAYTLQEITLSLRGTTELGDIASVSLFKADESGSFSTDTPIFSAQKPKMEMNFSGNFAVNQDTLVVWVSIKLKDSVDLSHRVNANCLKIGTSEGVLKPSENQQINNGLRVGVAVRRHGQDGVHTSRIPGLATTRKGTLLAIYDARRESARDLQGDMDIALNRSADGGKTWQPMQIILDKKQWGGLPEKYNGVSDACLLVDENSERIFVAGLWMHGVLDAQTGKWVDGLTEDSTRWIHQWQAKGSQPGLGVKETSQFIIAQSSDDGLTWSNPANITAETKKAEWWLLAPAPGQGITMTDGTLVFPTQGRDENGEPFSNITWSKDGGKTWTTSNPAHKNTTECAVVELGNGTLMLNMRDNRNRGNLEENGRSVFITTDLGETWSEHPTSRRALIEPTCMASLHKHTYNEGGEEKSILLFSNPASATTRENITLKASFDDGQTWPEEKHILLDEGRGRGYSCITSVNDSTIGILYESSRADLVFQTISLKEIAP